MCSSSSTASGKPEPLSLNSHSGVPALIHRPVIQKGKLNGFTAPVAGPLSHLPSVRRNWRTSNTQLASGTGEVPHLGGKIPKHGVLKANASIPRPPRVCCFQQARSTALDLTDGNQQRFACTAPPKKHCVGSPQTGFLENPRCSTDLIASAS